MPDELGRNNRDMTDLPSAADFETLIKSRHSTRAYRPDPIPDALLRHIFEVAQYAPSNCNTQPWIVHVASGDAIAKAREVMFACATTQPIDADVAYYTSYPGIYRGRQIEAAKALFAATGIAREDIEARTASGLRNFRFFDAPHVAFMFLQREFGMREAADCGMYAQTLMLAMQAHGVSSCAQGALSYYPGALRELFNIDADLICLFGISFGYADEDAPANATRTTRLPLGDSVVFHDKVAATQD